MRVSEILKAAKATLTPTTWGQGDGSTSCVSLPRGRTCMMMACAYHGYSEWHDRQDAIALLGRVVSGSVRTALIAEWNDTPGRTLQDVREAFDAAIAIAEEQERSESAARSGEPSATVAGSPSSELVGVTTRAE